MTVSTSGRVRSRQSESIGAHEAQESIHYRGVGFRARGALQRGGMSGTAYEEAVFKEELTKFAKNVQGWTAIPIVGISVTSADTERKAYRQMVALRDYAQAIFKGTTKNSIWAWLESESARWLEDRQKALTGVGENKFDLGTIKDRLLKNIPTALAIVGGTPPTSTTPSPGAAAAASAVQAGGISTTTLLLVIGGAAVAAMALKR